MLSIVEGITEFLPISSTGHLILVSKLLTIEPTAFSKSFEIIIQLGAICSVLFLYTKEVFVNKKIILRIIVSFIPTAVIGFLLYSFVKDVLLESSEITTLALLVGGIVLIGLELIYKEKDSKINSIGEVSYPRAFLIGVLQSLSIVPGVSRAAATIMGGLGLGLSRRTAVEYSFLLAVPTMLGASVLDIYKSSSSFSQSNVISLVIGFAVSFLVALGAIKFLLRFVKTNNFIPFGVYRIILALTFWLLVIR